MRQSSGGDRSSGAFARNRTQHIAEEKLSRNSISSKETSGNDSKAESKGYDDSVSDVHSISRKI
jgi:hypothetical protein